MQTLLFPLQVPPPGQNIEVSYLQPHHWPIFPYKLPDSSAQEVGYSLMFSSLWRFHTCPCCSLCLKIPIQPSLSSSLLFQPLKPSLEVVFSEKLPLSVWTIIVLRSVYELLALIFLTPNMFSFLAPTNSPILGTPTECPRIQSNSDTNYSELVHTTQIKSSVPQNCYFNTNRKSGPPKLLTNHL